MSQVPGQEQSMVMVMAIYFNLNLATGRSQADLLQCA
jgi:hypothetical protein